MGDGPVRVETDADLRGMREAAASLIGTIVVDVGFRPGSMLGVLLGQHDAGRRFRILVHTGAWRIDGRDDVLVASQDPEDAVRREINALVGRRFTDCEIGFPALDTTLTLGEFHLRIFPDHYHHPSNAFFWTMRLPSGDLLFAGPASTWCIRRSRGSGPS